MSNGPQDHGDVPMTPGSMSDGSMNMSSMDMVMHMSFVSLSKIKTGLQCNVGAISEASVYAVRMVLAYMVMLAVMSFNLGIFIAAVAGHAIGLFFVKARALANSNRGM
ncbi:hypothetical protein GH714_015821 [Hevea brasiliensis]|uniref:Copper transport protein n=1 Tax=Hevea brasiliensis TaxID=3981 RepID=A0A6A6M1M2_HEVBR|nr:hypothetical protein GH714_015821 [Hevea brasiliensis]